ncbi:Zinc finger matrin-type protein 2 [Paramicrosporidium saccamoebae]|uniref:Zinc finger matrin-type protein 2 n=1 Tax=Paramicrosporidium saccamoebae TaxID=1246581 RepID=A0A2H9TGU0_9FUNG|nr:Zinc finger matrin-type protein 2 [Paramicrosporidium saccamoebae]
MQTRPINPSTAAGTSTRLVNPNTAEAAGFRCDLCAATFTAYDAYLDHCNSRLHQRNLGTPTVERVDDVERIRARLQLLRERKAKKTDVNEVTKDMEERLAQQKKEEEERRRQKYDRKKNKAPQAGDQEEDEEAKLMSSILGISSFK